AAEVPGQSVRDGAAAPQLPALSPGPPPARPGRGGDDAASDPRGRACRRPLPAGDDAPRPPAPARGGARGGPRRRGARRQPPALGPPPDLDLRRPARGRDGAPAGAPPPVLADR